MAGTKNLLGFFGFIAAIVGACLFQLVRSAGEGTGVLVLVWAGFLFLASLVLLATALSLWRPSALK